MRRMSVSSVASASPPCAVDRYGQPILGDQTLTRQETLWLATAATKWFIWEHDLGLIDVGNHVDLAILDRDYFTVPDDEIKRLRSVMTIVGGKVVHSEV